MFFIFVYYLLKKVDTKSWFTNGLLGQLASSLNPKRLAIDTVMILPTHNSPTPAMLWAKQKQSECIGRVSNSSSEKSSRIEILTS